MISLRTKLIAAAILLGVVGYFGYKVYHKHQLAIESAQTHEAQQLQHQAQTNASNGATHAQQGANQETQAATHGEQADAHGQISGSMDGRIASLNAEVARLRKRAADAEADAASRPVHDPGDVEIIGKQAELVDTLTAQNGELKLEIGELHLQVTELKGAVISWKTSSGDYAAAYDNERRSHIADNIAHEAHLRALKAEGVMTRVKDVAISVGTAGLGGYLLGRHK